VTRETSHREADYVAATGGIVSAYVSNNSVPASDLPSLIMRVHGAVAALARGAAAVGADMPRAAEPERPNAAQIRRSVRDDGIVSFIDGKSYKTLKRHLTSHGLDPHRYRERYGLPGDYPMVAPSYAARRSALAKAIGLGVPGARADRRTGGQDS
jgi:predicted transcriptional regulator